MRPRTGGTSLGAARSPQPRDLTLKLRRTLPEHIPLSLGLRNPCRQSLHLRREPLVLGLQQLDLAAQVGRRHRLSRSRRRKPDRRNNCKHTRDHGPAPRHHGPPIRPARYSTDDPARGSHHPARTIAGNPADPTKPRRSTACSSRPEHPPRKASTTWRPPSARPPRPPRHPLRRILAGKLPGERRSKRRGQSVEFDDYRPYIPGDDLRHIDWNIYARFDRFVLKLFREEEDLAVHVLIDASASMFAGGDGQAPSKVIFVHRLAMTLGYLALVAQNRVQASVVGAGPGLGPQRPGGVVSLGPIRGRTGVRRLADFLLTSLAQPLEARAGAPQDLNQAMRTIALSRASRGVMIILSDFLIPGGVTRGLNFLAGGSTSGRYDTHCIQVLAPAELDPSARPQPGLSAIFA